MVSSKGNSLAGASAVTVATSPAASAGMAANIIQKTTNTQTPHLNLLVLKYMGVPPSII